MSAAGGLDSLLSVAQMPPASRSPAWGWTPRATPPSWRRASSRCRIGRRLLRAAGHGDQPVGLQRGEVDLVQGREPLVARDHLELDPRDLGPGERSADQPAVADQDGRPAVEQAIQRRGAVGQVVEGPIPGEDDRGADERPGDRVVVPDDPVLHGVGHQHHDQQVHGVAPAQRPLPGQAQRDDEEPVDEHRPGDLLAHADLEVPDVGPHASRFAVSPRSPAARR